MEDIDDARIVEVCCCLEIDTKIGVFSPSCDLYRALFQKSSFFFFDRGFFISRSSFSEHVGYNQCARITQKSRKIKSPLLPLRESLLFQSLRGNAIERFC